MPRPRHPLPAAPAPQLRFRLGGADGKEQVFRVTLDAKLKKAMLKFAELSQLPAATLTFRYDGRRIKPEDTPTSLGIAGAREEAIADGEDPSEFKVQIDVSSAGA